MNWCAAKKRILRGLAAGGTLWPEAAPFGVGAFAPLEVKPSLKVLLVVAHPDDESECAAVLYRITHELGGVVDQVTVTNGEAGFHWASPAQEFYGLSLAEEHVGRKHLPRIRRKEVLRANRILGIRRSYFLDQQDTGFTFDAHVGLDTWNTSYVTGFLSRLIKQEEYDLVLTLLPTADTHGHHKSVAILLLQAVASFPREQRPATLGLRTQASEENHSEPYAPLPGFPLTETTSAASVWQFDRATTFGRSGLPYSIIANWVIAEHKSQGMFQMELGRHAHEHFWLFEVTSTNGRQRFDSCLRLLENSSSSRSYASEERVRAYA
jgi:LmbE family N-acetylglucosaminyl deacetylase